MQRNAKRVSGSENKPRETVEELKMWINAAQKREGLRKAFLRILSER